MLTMMHEALLGVRLEWIQAYRYFVILLGSLFQLRIITTTSWNWDDLYIAVDSVETFTCYDMPRIHDAG